MNGRTILAVHTLLQQAPALAPAADFAQRTIARLPNRRARLTAIGRYLYTPLAWRHLAPGAWILAFLYDQPCFPRPQHLKQLMGYSPASVKRDGRGYFRAAGRLR
ncbi:MAG: hypothetical protein M5U34_43045 [Chloroflexi bacterium]|nr:hypothetical protein [Chloroflexota bacterium]